MVGVCLLLDLSCLSYCSILLSLSFHVNNYRYVVLANRYTATKMSMMPSIVINRLIQFFIMCYSFNVTFLGHSISCLFRKFNLIYRVIFNYI